MSRSNCSLATRHARTKHVRNMVSTFNQFCQCQCQQQICTVHSRKASNALCTLVKREKKKSFQVPAKTVAGTWRISQVVWQRVPGRRARRSKGPTTEH